MIHAYERRGEEFVHKENCDACLSEHNRLKIFWQCNLCDGWFEGINIANLSSEPLCPSCLAARHIVAWHNLCDLLEKNPEIKKNFDSVVVGEGVGALHFGGRTLEIEREHPSRPPESS
jgi:hypothetical protein